MGLTYKPKQCGVSGYKFMRDAKLAAVNDYFTIRSADFECYFDFDRLFMFF